MPLSVDSVIFCTSKACTVAAKALLFCSSQNCTAFNSSMRFSISSTLTVGATQCENGGKPEGVAEVLQKVEPRNEFAKAKSR